VAMRGGTRFRVRSEDVFPAGCVLGPDTEVAKVVDFDKRGAADDQERDKVTGERVWVVRVTDLDPDLAGRARETAVKISSPVQPVAPGGPFSPVEFENLSVTPWVNPNNRLQYSFRATGIVAAKTLAEHGQQAAPHNSGRVDERAAA
jgi:hypothetical protein